MNTVTNTTTSKGLKWGPFTLRIPFIHLRFRAGEFFQGMVISGATAFAAVPIAMGLGLTFEEGVALSFIAGTELILSEIRLSFFEFPRNLHIS